MIPRFYPILDTATLALRKTAAAAIADVLLTAGVGILQYRHKDNWTQRHYEEAAHLAELCRTAGAQFVINDRADYAHLIGAGVHLGQDDLPPVAARRIMGDAFIGFSTHSKRQLVRGEEEPVRYLAIGPVFATTSKLKPDPVIGIEPLKTLRPLTKKPLVAIGGITLENAGSVFETGIDSVAVLSGFLTEDCKPAGIATCAKKWLML